MKTIKIIVSADEGFVADSLREIANEIECSEGVDYPANLEGEHYVSHIIEED